MEREKVFGIVEYIVSQGAVHDFQDVVEFGVVGVLGMYDIHIDLTGQERRSLREWLERLGECVQAREMARLAFGEVDSLLSDIISYKWSLKDELLFRKVFLAGLRSKQNTSQDDRLSGVLSGVVCLREVMSVESDILGGCSV